MIPIAFIHLVVFFVVVNDNAFNSVLNFNQVFVFGTKPHFARVFVSMISLCWNIGIVWMNVNYLSVQKSYS